MNSLTTTRMVLSFGLIEHAHDTRTPAPTAWLLTGVVAIGLLAVIVAANSLADARRLAAAYRPLSAVMASGAEAAAIVGWARPAPWLLAALLVVILSVLWAVAVRSFLRVGAWGDEASSGGERRVGHARMRCPHSLLRGSPTLTLSHRPTVGAASPKSLVTVGA